MMTKKTTLLSNIYLSLTLNHNNNRLMMEKKEKYYSIMQLSIIKRLYRNKCLSVIFFVLFFAFIINIRNQQVFLDERSGKRRCHSHSKRRRRRRGRGKREKVCSRSILSPIGEKILMLMMMMNGLSDIFIL